MRKRPVANCKCPIGHEQKIEADSDVKVHESLSVYNIAHPTSMNAGATFLIQFPTNEFDRFSWYTAESLSEQKKSTYKIIEIGKIEKSDIVHMRIMYIQCTYTYTRYITSDFSRLKNAIW